MVLFWNESQEFVGIAAFLWFILRRCQLLRLCKVCGRILLNDDLETLWKMAVAA